MRSSSYCVKSNQTSSNMKRNIFLVIVVYLLAVINLCATLTDAYDVAASDGDDSVDFVVSYKNKSNLLPVSVSQPHQLRHQHRHQHHYQLEHRQQQHHLRHQHQQHNYNIASVASSPQNRTAHVFRNTNNNNPHRHHKAHYSHTDNSHHQGGNFRVDSSISIKSGSANTGYFDKFTTKSPIESVRNFLSSREHDPTPPRRTHRLAVPTIPPHFTRSVTSPLPAYYQPNNFIGGGSEHKSKSSAAHHHGRSTHNAQRGGNTNTNNSSGGSGNNSGNLKKRDSTVHAIKKSGNLGSSGSKPYRGDYERVKDKTFDEIAREISKIRNRKRIDRTTTTSTSTTSEAPITPGLDGDYDNDDDYFQDGEAEDDREDHHDDSTAAEQDLSYQKKYDFRQYQADSSLAYNTGDLTQLKIQQLGTAHAVRETRRRYMESSGNQRDRWRAHMVRTDSEGKCKIPKPKVVLSSEDPSKRYVPRCTILHRCSDDTACCPSASHTCVAKHTEWVELDFQVFTGDSYKSVTKPFENHTLCHCVDKSEYRSQVPEPIKQPDESCSCPSVFVQKIEDGECKCECSGDECKQKRQGREHFSMEERGCISRGPCKRPRCDFGEYRADDGRCPRREDRFRGINRSSSTLVPPNQPFYP